MAVYDRTLWHGAELIHTEYPSYFNPEYNPWASMRDRGEFFQHSDFEPWKGLPIFVKDFEAENPKSAKILFTALGCIDIWINGKRIGNDELKPGWTEYGKRVLYDEYDVTENLISGTNRILAVVSNGWYSGRIAGTRYGSHDPAVMICLNVTDKNGNKSIVTDEQWKTSVGGPILNADIWDGEYFDARQDSFSKMSVSDYDVSSWKNPELCDYFDGEVSKLIGTTVQVRENLNVKADKITVFDGTKDNSTDFGEIVVVATPENFPVDVKCSQKVVIDLGQEVVGWVKIKAVAEKGTKLKIRYSEMLNDSGDKSRGNDGPKGSVYTINMRSAMAKSHYIFAGNEAETYRPTFTFFGFRFVEISADSDFVLSDFIAEVVGSVTEETGYIETSDKLVNKLISNVMWGQRSNYLSVPTDCPQRDERLGWTGDAQAFSRTASYNAKVLEFFRKWLQDMRDSQSEEGAYSDVAPRVGICSSENASAWGDAGVIIPYNLYVMYGDKSIIEEHYASMEKYIAQLVAKNGFTGAEPRYGDWLAYDLCKKEFISSAYFIHDIDLMIEMSNAIGKADRAEHYKTLRKQAHKYFEDTFMKDGELIGKTQADYTISIAFNLLDDKYVIKATKELVRLIKENGNRLSTGFLGTYNLCPVLSKVGEDNMAYTLLLQRNEPSWLYSIDQGATTIWERWNSYTKDKGFGDVGMNSFNHYAYGAIQEWMYRYMAGIETDGIGFEKILLQPRIDTRTTDELPNGQERIKWVKASYNSVVGLIESSWSYDAKFIYECSVPQNSSATLMLPILGKELLINGVKHDFSEFEINGNCAVIRLASGEYVFEEE